MKEFRIKRGAIKLDNLSIQKYLREISKIKLLSIDEEEELFIRINEGDREALNKLVTANLRFVVSVAKQFQNKGISINDLINEGNIGLILAAERFDMTRGFKFTSYAIWWIRESILKALKNYSRQIYLPVHQVENVAEINKTFALLEQELQYTPAVEQVSERLNIKTADIVKILNLFENVVSLDAPLNVGNDNKKTLNMYDVLAMDNTSKIEEKLDYESLQKEIEQILSFLNERESEVIRLYYGINEEKAYSQKEIALRHNVSEEWIRQIRIKAIQKIQANINDKLLESYFGGREN